ncbi:NAD(P)-dependent oxidoreductase [Piscinibacter sakaiensis]|uniref:NAD(P)-dependent oxidoreductase n=1 Tax=Piscinibacter sakaiensis TaxID=1547922 RepID=UPI00372D3CF3
MTSAAFGVDDGLLARLPALQVVSSFGVGLDRIDRAAAARRGVVVGYTPDVLNDCVADQAFGLLLAVARRLPAADRYVRAGGFDMAVRYHSRRAVPDVPWQHEPSLRALAAWCDFLVVITAGGAETRHLIDAAVLDALGPQGFLVNVARGSVVDEAALVQALADGRIAGAGLDVFEHEPQVPEALRAMDHVVLAPHTASATIETRRAMGERVADNLDAWFRERRLVSAAPAP